MNGESESEKNWSEGDVAELFIDNELFWVTEVSLAVGEII